MSLLKVYRNELLSRPLESILGDFKDAFHVGASDRFTKDDVITLVAFYAEFGVAYLQYVSETFEEPEGSQQTMKFMNSLIAEAVHEAGLHYYDKERGYSIVDKAVQAAIDNGGIPLTSDVRKIVQEIEESHIEETFEDMDEETLAAEE